MVTTTTIYYYKLAEIQFETYDAKIRRYRPYSLDSNNLLFLNKAALIEYCKNFLNAAGKYKNTNNGFFFPKNCRCWFSQSLAQIEAPYLPDEDNKIIDFSKLNGGNKNGRSGKKA